MEITTKTKVLIAVAALAVAFGAGYYVTPTKTVTKTEIKEVIKEVEVKHVDQHRDTVTTETETHKPDGTTVIQRQTVDRDQTVTDSTRTGSETKTSDTTKTVERRTPSWSVAGMAAIDVSNRKIGGYGLHIQRKVLGPITVGAFGMTDGNLGVSIGVNF